MPPLNRRTPIKRKTPLKRSQKPIARNTRPKQVSQKRKSLNALYKIARTEYLKHNPRCAAAITGICSGVATDVHHKKGRLGDYFLAVAYWLGVCRSCHTWIELHPEDAKELGFSESRLTR